MSAFKKLGETRVWQGQLVAVDAARFAAPDGSEFEREVVRHPGAVSVVPLLEDGRTVLLVRQYRAALERALLEVPAGKRDVAGEPPETTAGRELEEEVGMRAGRLDLLAEFFNSAGFCDERSFVYLGTGLTACATTAYGVEEQHMTIERRSLDDVPALIASGEIVDAKTIIGLLLARERAGGKLP